MIFVTVGTHEQQFNRLIEHIDLLIEKKIIREEVIVQSGFSNYQAKNFECKNIIPYSEMIENIKKARIVITHGGPATFIIPLQEGKIPIVVPRQRQFNEHINDHQVEFAKLVYERQGNIIVVENIQDLGKIISDYDEVIKEIPKDVASNNEKFNIEFKKIVNNLFEF